MTAPDKSSPTLDRELVLTRIIDAPRAKVFRAWTDPALLKAVVCSSALDNTSR